MEAVANRRTRFYLLLGVILGVLICGPAHSIADEARVYIFGEDSRRDPVCESEAFAYRARAVARFREGTAFLISPENHVLTAAHAFTFDVEATAPYERIGTLRFNFQQAECLDNYLPATFHDVDVYRKDLLVINRELDFALLQLPYTYPTGVYDPDADVSVGVFGFRWLDIDPFTRLTELSDTQKELYVLGYNFEFLSVKLSADEDCRITNEKGSCMVIEAHPDDGGPWGGPYNAPENACVEHHCDTMQSNSGSPLFLKHSNKVIGIDSGVNTGLFGTGLGAYAEAVKIRQIYPEIKAFLPTEEEMADADGDLMPNCRDNCPDVPNTGTCIAGLASKLNVPNSCISHSDCDSSYTASDGNCDRSQLQIDYNGDGTGDHCSALPNPELYSTGHGRGQPSCNPEVRLQWHTPVTTRGISGYSVVIVNQDDPFYDDKRMPDDIAELGASATSFVTPSLTPGHVWEINIRTIDAAGVPAEHYASYWVRIETCGFEVTSPRAGSTNTVGDWNQIVWGLVEWDGNDVSAGYSIESIDLYQGNDALVHLWDNYPNLGGISWLVPDVPPGQEYKIGILLKRNSAGDQFPTLPQRLLGFSEYFTIIQDQESYSISGSAYNYPQSSRYRATISIDIQWESSIPSGSLQYYSVRTRMNFMSAEITAVSIVDDTAIIAGTGSVNGAGGYTFEATITDNSPDRFGFLVKDSEGGIYYETTSTDISGGDLTIERQ